jgi:hypothetical protein
VNLVDPKRITEACSGTANRRPSLSTSSIGPTLALVIFPERLTLSLVLLILLSGVTTVSLSLSVQTARPSAALSETELQRQLLRTKQHIHTLETSYGTLRGSTSIPTKSHSSGPWCNPRSEGVGSSQAPIRLVAIPIQTDRRITLFTGRKSLQRHFSGVDFEKTKDIFVRTNGKIAESRFIPALFGADYAFSAPWKN